jgi:transposase-like protein
MNDKRRDTPMKRIAKKREIVNGRIEVSDELVKELLEVEDNQILGRIRGELFGLFKLLIERTMQLELGAKLGYEPYQSNSNRQNSRNGYRERKKLVLKEGVIENIKIPRDRAGEYQTAGC